MVSDELVRDHFRAERQRALANLIRSVPQSERSFVIASIKAMAILGNPTHSIDKDRLAVMAAVVFDDSLWDAATQVRQCVVLQDALKEAE